MRLQLDTNGSIGSAEAASQNGPLTGAGRSGATAQLSESGAAGTDSSVQGPGSDQVAVSGASNAWSASFSDRAVRLGQLTAAVQNGTYRIPGAAISQSIVSSALAAA
jgi:hypothetical protein